MNLTFTGRRAALARAIARWEAAGAWEVREAPFGLWRSVPPTPGTLSGPSGSTRPGGRDERAPRRRAPLRRPRLAGVPVQRQAADGRERLPRRHDRPGNGRVVVAAVAGRERRGANRRAVRAAGRRRGRRRGLRQPARTRARARRAAAHRVRHHPEGWPALLFQPSRRGGPVERRTTWPRARHPRRLRLRHRATLDRLRARRAGPAGGTTGMAARAPPPRATQRQHAGGGREDRRRASATRP